MSGIRIQLDESSKLVLQYIAQVREERVKKNKKWPSGKCVVTKPSDYPNMNLQQLSDTLVRAAYNVSMIDEYFLDHLKGLVINGSFKWHHVLRSVINTSLTDMYMKCQLCGLVREMIHRVQIDSFSDREGADDIIKTLGPIFDFVSQTILVVLQDEHEFERMMLDNDDFIKPYWPPLQALSSIIHDEFCRTLLIIHCPEEVKKRLHIVYDAFCEPESPDETAVGLMEMLIELYDKSCQPKEFEYIPEGLTLFDFKNPSIKILVSIFACFKMQASCEYISETIQTFAEIMRISPADVVYDLIHAAYLLKCEESIDLDRLHLPKEHRVDFRWQTTTFFYHKLGPILLYLVNKEKVSKNDLIVGLERAYKDFTMMFDVADKLWQNASFVVLIRELSHVLGQQQTEKFLFMRREHMEKVPELKPLVELNDVVLKNTDVQHFHAAIAECKQPDEDVFLQKLVEKVDKGECEMFDALTSVLTADGNLMRVGKKFAKDNINAQMNVKMAVDKRMKIFDGTFLLMSRILIRNPSVSIRLFLNGGPQKSEAEKAIFFNWAMWYIKRVAKHPKPEPKNEEDLEIMRQEVATLVRVANADVGIEEEFEQCLGEEDEKEKGKQKKLIQEEQKMDMAPSDSEFQAAEMPTASIFSGDPLEGVNMEMDEFSSSQNILNNEERMSSENATVSENPAEMKKEAPTEMETIPKSRSKNEIEITWQAFNCPLPRISRKTGRKYLNMLKQSQPFWNVNDVELNFGALVAAVPVIGQLLLEEHEEKRYRADFQNILHAIGRMSCLLVCLVEWMDCEPDSPARTSLAFSIQSALEKSSTSIEDPNHSKWKFVLSTIQHMLIELTDKSPVFPEVTCTAFSTARRFCPFVYRNEKPDQVKLKHAWYYMRQQTWASPHALRLLEHANIAGEYNSWSHIYLNKTMKTGCGDLMKSSVDMIFSFLMMDDFNSIIRMHESLMDFWLNEDAANCQIDGRFDPLAMRAIIRLMTQVMLLAEWSLDRLINEEPKFEPKLQLNTSIEAPEIDDPDRREKWIYLMRSALERTVNRFSKILRLGQLSTVVNTIIQIIKSIAGSADCHAKRLLIRRIHPEMIFQLAYIEPSSVNFPLMEMFCENDNKEHNRLKIMFLCALRRSNII